MDARYWHAQLDREERAFKPWREGAKDLVKRYRDDERSGGVKLNIFWANTETLKPVAYGRLPEPIVRRRYLDADPIGLMASDLTQKALAWTIDDNGAHKEFERVRDDLLIVGRGVARIKYDAEFATYRPTPVYGAVAGDGDGEMGEPIGYELDGEIVEPDFDDDGPYIERKDKEAVYACYVHWDRFKCDPAQSWEEVKWVAFKHLMSKSDLKKHFGRKKANTIELTHSDKEADKPSYACVWEIWSRASKKRIWVAEGHDKILDEEDDPLKLEGFFPCPEPASAIRTTDSLIPVPEFWVYQDQADELDEVVSRISNLVKAAQAKGLYAGSHKEIIDLVAEGTDGQLRPVDDPSLYAQSGGLEKSITWMPIEKIVASIVQLTQRELHLKQQIFEVSGISDLMRGATRASETAAAQQLKGQYGAARTGPRAEPMRQLVRDLYRMMAEVMCRFFSEKEWARITGVMPPPEVMQLMRDPEAFEFRVDIETDATVAEDAAQKKAEAIEFVTAFTQYLQAAGTIVEGQPATAQMMGEITKWILRRFGTAKDLEKVISQTMDMLAQQASQPKPDPEMQKVQAQVQLEQQKMQMQMEAKKAEFALKQQEMQASVQIDQQKAQMAMAAERAKAEQEMQIAQMKAATELRISQQKAANDEQIAQRKSAMDMQVSRQKAANDVQLTNAKSQATAPSQGEAMMNRTAQMQLQAAEVQTKAAAAMAEAVGLIAKAAERMAAPRRVKRGADGRVESIEAMAG